MSAIAYICRCDSCGTEFEAPEVPEMSYGLFVMRTLESSEAVFLDAHKDAAFLESYDIVKRNPFIRGLTPEECGKIQQTVFSVTCDRSPAGKSFEIGIPPKCPSCGSRVIQSWHPVEPFRDWPLPSVGHRSWESKSPVEREALIDDAVRRLLEGGANR